jgi:tRNA (uracil-5-)-methyltransferase TRM9
MIGLDRSKNLLEIAKHAGGEDKSEVREVILGDVLSGCWRMGIFVRSQIYY